MEVSSQENFETVKASKGSHFQFKSEKEWQSSDVPISSIFRMNMKTLAEDLSTIPFYKRQGIPKELFSEQELMAMDKEAQMCFERKKNKSDFESVSLTVKEVNHEQAPSISSVINIQSNVKSLEIKETPKKTDDLEDWLDSVLDD